MGVTSRGIFLKPKTKWVIFLSFEDHRGPMTINLKGDISPLRDLTPGELIQISPNLITVPKHNLAISTQHASIWQPVLINSETHDRQDMSPRLKAFTQDAYAQNSGVGLSGSLPALLDFPAEKGQDSDGNILSIRNHIKHDDLIASLELIENLLGRGSGLTPSGDDFIIGLLLTLNRWNDALGIGNELQSFNVRVVEAAYAKTTTLSANLIECAAEGQGDERLIAALDFLMTGESNQDRLLNELLNWGNSSGVDALVGMVVGISPKLD